MLALAKQINNYLFIIMTLLIMSLCHADLNLGRQSSHSILNLSPKTETIIPQNNFLPPNEVFKPSLIMVDDHTVMIKWSVNPDYYLYKSKIGIKNITEGISIKEIHFPDGKSHSDEFFGEQEIYDQDILIEIKFDNPIENIHTLFLTLEAQGCAKAGLCFAPYTWDESLEINPELPQNQPIVINESISNKVVTPIAEHDRLSQFLLEQRFLALPLFFLFGVLLTFTPCVLPMLPILSGILTGQKTLTKKRGFLISLAYVLPMALIYTFLGVLAAFLGKGIAGALQNMYVLIGFSAIFVLLSLSMFGAYQLQLPVALQNKLNAKMGSSQSGTYYGAAIMGALSALIVGPCVTAPLIGIITLIAQTQDYLLGASALFSMGMGMGVPLMLLGVSSGHLLPKAGAWMNAIKQFFGFILLAVAAYFLGRVIPFVWEQLLYAAIAISLSIWFIYHIVKSKQLNRLFFIPTLLSVMFAGYFIYSSSQQEERYEFTYISGIQELNSALNQNANGITMLEFNADWCVACKEMEKYVFGNEEVKKRFAQMNTLATDVTQNNKADQQLQKHFNLFGPPAILFFDDKGNELPQYRIMGAVSAEQFIEHLDRLLNHQ